MRAAIWRWVRAKAPEAEIPPGWMVVVRAVLFPLDTLYWRMSRTRGYQPESDTWLINGRCYAAQVFDTGGLLSPPGSAVRIVADSGDGVWVERLFDFEKHLARQREFSDRTFGPGLRTQMVVDHIRKELIEVLAKPEDLTEWIDVAILALDGAWRTGATPQDIIDALFAKQIKNESRIWPDWRTSDLDKAIEHVRSKAACKHKNGHPEWDFYQCDDCGWIRPSGQMRGPHQGWFPTLDCAKAWDKYRTYPGMEPNGVSAGGMHA